MGQAKKHLEEMREKEELDCFLNYLIEYGGLEGPALGIAKLVIDKDISVLSPKQKDVFDKFIMTKETPKCNRCGCDIPWIELEISHENCGYCEHKLAKDD